jgi:photosystem II stability/assembly factor-like uncharacterized protein
MQHRWAGTIFDSFTLDGQEVWTCEDGGRIRHRDGAGVWTYQGVPDVVKLPVLRLHFLTGGQTGWAVSQDGWLLKTVNGGGLWSTVLRSDQLPGSGGVVDQLWDVHFLDQSVGWLLGFHAMWYTDNGGSTWQSVTLLKSSGAAFSSAELQELEFYALDVVTGVNPPLLGMASCEPGLVFRMQLQPFNPTIWQVVFDIRNLCGTTALQGCEDDICQAVAPAGSPPPNYEPWDLELGRNPPDKLAILFGGWGFHCGMIFVSTDDGTTWVKENHECYCPTGSPSCYDCTHDPNFYNDPADPGDTWYFDHFEAIYGGAIVNGNGSAVACGYGGQIAVRDPATGKWHDKSQYSADYVTTPSAVTTPMRSVSAPPGVASNTTVLVAGVGGYMRRSANGGSDWVTEPTTNGTVGEPWRIGDVSFFDLTQGWMVSQYFRLAKSVTGAATWNQASPPPQEGTTKLLSIAFSPDPAKGVAVGQPNNLPGPNQYKPKILFTADGGLTSWLEATQSLAPFYNGTQLREAECTGGSHFWAAGSKGLIMQSIDGGATWWSVLPPNETIMSLSKFDIEGLGFASASKLLFVGSRPEGTAVAYQFRDLGTSITWTSVGISDPNPPSSGVIKDLADVDISGGTAYAVGYRENPSGVRTGVLLKSVVNGSGDFQAFTILQEEPECSVIEDNEFRMSVFNQIEIIPGTLDAIIGGECGRVWKLQASPFLWTELKSQTSAGIVGISMPSANVGYFAAHRTDLLGTSHSIVRYNP